MSNVANAIRETVSIAEQMRVAEVALRDAVESDDDAAILTAARNLFRRNDGGRDRALARLERRPGRS